MPPLGLPGPMVTRAHRRVVSADLREGLATAVAAIALAVVVGAVVGRGYALPLFASFVAAGALAVGMTNWRWSVHALIAYIPVSGVLTVVLYPASEPGVLAKDLLFVGPAYVGFFAAFVSARRRIVPPAAPVGLFVLLALLVLGQCLNPSLPNAAVPLIGLRVWLLYLPMYILGYHLLRTRDDLSKVLRLLVITGLVPCVIGIIEAVLLYTGKHTFVYSLYGDAASAVTQNFAALPERTDGHTANLLRVPSTFSFVTQYYLFTAVMVAASYALMRGAPPGSRDHRLGAVALGIAVPASITSGARGALIFVPFLLVLMTLLDRRSLGSSARMIAISVASVVGLVALLGTTARALFGKVLDIGVSEFSETFVTGTQEALSMTVAGLGTGVAGISSRYAFDQQAVFPHLNGYFFESWWVKVILEIGIVGLLVVIALFASILARGFRNHLLLSDPDLRATSAAILALLVWVLVYDVKGQYSDTDPINVYFWLFAGLLTRLPAFQAPVTVPEPAADPRAARFASGATVDRRIEARRR